MRSIPNNTVDTQTTNQPQNPLEYTYLLNKAKVDINENAIKSISEVPIRNSKPVTFDFTLSEFD